MAQYRATHQEENRIVNANWRKANKEILTEKRRRYQKENAEIVNAWCMERHCKKLQRMPLWADKDALKAVYQNCPKGMHVDHIIPLQGELVSGLHIAENLQYLTPAENSRKRNFFEPLFITQNQCSL